MLAARYASPMEIEREVLSVFPKSADIKYHVSLIKTEHGNYLDFREFVVSLNDYGRGVTFPADHWDLISRVVSEKLEEVSHEGADDSDPLPVV